MIAPLPDPSDAEANRADDRRSWTILELIQWTERYFQKLGFESPRLDAEVLLAEVLGAQRLDLYTEYGKLVEPHERATFREYVRRRASREPVAYITGEREFYSLPFEVNPAVLIPRPETEHIVDAVLETFRDHAPGVVLLDVGTGSGNLAVAIAANLEGARVDAVDASADALEVARRNADRNGVRPRIQFLEGDLFAALPSGCGPYDAVVSNPPYISATSYEGLMEDVRKYEPRQALLDTRSVGQDGLGFYRALAETTREHLRPGGELIVEVGFDQATSVEKLFAEQRWHVKKKIRDYGGIDRVLVFTY